MKKYFLDLLATLVFVPCVLVASILGLTDEFCELIDGVFR